MTNAVPVAATARQPRAIIKLNGQAVAGWVSWTVDNNSYFEADTYRVSFAISALPAGYDPSWFASQTETFVEILAGFPSDPANPNAAELTSLIYGRADEIRYDLLGTTIDIKGRDLTAAFIDSRLIADYANQTSSGIVMALAAKHGIATQITPTRTPVGVYFQRDRVLMRAGRSEWDLISYLARSEKFVAYFDQQTLFFGPDPLPSADPYSIQWGTDQSGNPFANVLAISFSRSQTVTKGVAVTVRSADPLNKSVVVANYPSAPRTIQAGKASPFGDVQTYSFTLPPGRTPAQCQAFAQARYHEIVSHEMKLEARLPGDVLLSSRQMVKVSGTGTAFDQSYFPRSITRSMSREGGFTMTVAAQNQSPQLVQ